MTHPEGKIQGIMCWLPFTHDGAAVDGQDGKNARPDPVVPFHPVSPASSFSEGGPFVSLSKSVIAKGPGEGELGWPRAMSSGWARHAGCQLLVSRARV